MGGLTGKARENKQSIISQFGRGDPYFNEELDCAAGIRHVDNILVIPLLIDSNKGKELVGVVQFINYKYGNVPQKIAVLFLYFRKKLSH